VDRVCVEDSGSIEENLCDAETLTKQKQTPVFDPLISHLLYLTV